MSKDDDLVPTPRFTGIFIPSEILEMDGLTSTDIMLLSWIDALYSKEHGGCFASNSYFVKKLKLKENTVKVLISKLVSMGLVERVSFDGRRRILRACKENWYGSTAGVDYNQPQGVTEINPCPSLESTPLIYREKSIEKSIDSTPRSPGVEVAIAPDGGDQQPSCMKPKKMKRVFSDQVREVSDKMLAILAKHSPVYRPPPDLTKFLVAVQEMIEKEEQDPCVLLKVFEFGVSDTVERDGFKGWQGVIATNTRGRKVTNPAEMLKMHLPKLHAQMNSRPVRKFAAGTDLDAAMECMIEMDKRAL